jgi:predicted phosphodiesterase
MSGIRSIAIISDCHIEFGRLEIQNNGAEVLIMAGDIIVAENIKPRCRAFIEDVCAKFPQVIWVVGNHEHYNGIFSKTVDRLKGRFAHLTNLHILEKESVVLNGIRYVGATLWTDQFDRDPTSLRFSNNMNDFRCIRLHPSDPYTLFAVEHSVEDHYVAKEYIQETVSASTEPCVVITHHGVSEKSCHPRFKNNPLNGSFYSKLDEWVSSLPNTWLLCHGHTHDPFDYNLGPVRVVCNPRGYINHEPQADIFAVKYIPIPTK